MCFLSLQEFTLFFEAVLNIILCVYYFFAARGLFVGEPMNREVYTSLTNKEWAYFIKEGLTRQWRAPAGYVISEDGLRAKLRILDGLEAMKECIIKETEKWELSRAGKRSEGARRIFDLVFSKSKALKMGPGFPGCDEVEDISGDIFAIDDKFPPWKNKGRISTGRDV